MYYFIFDNPEDKNKMKFIENDNFFQVIFPSKKIQSLKDSLKYIKFLKKITHDNDILIFWYDFLGVLYKFKYRKTKVLILNILLKNKKTFKNKCYRILYKNVLKKKNIQTTVTSINYGNYIKKLLNVKNDFYLLHDPFHISKYKNECDQMTYCFCGGRNGRDWKLLIDIASELPNINFHFIMSKIDYDSYKNNFGPNIIVKTDISNEEFEKELCGCSFVTAPLNTESPAGLLLFYQAAKFKKMIITTKTLTTIEYFSENRGILCSKKSDWLDNIKYYSSNIDKTSIISNNFISFLEENCNENIYLDNIKQIIKKMED